MKMASGASGSRECGHGTSLTSFSGNETTGRLHCPSW